VTRPEPAVEGLRRHAQQRSDDARAAIEQALRDLRRRHQPVNVNAVGRRAGVSRKTVYNHTDLLEPHRPARTTPTCSNGSATTATNPEPSRLNLSPGTIPSSPGSATRLRKTSWIAGHASHPSTVAEEAPRAIDPGPWSLVAGPGTLSTSTENPARNPP
jgi:hypothetical protein